MQRVLVVDKNKKPLMPCHPARARELLNKGKAKVLRQFPFTIILTERECGDTQAIQAKVDPGAKTSGLALVADFKRGLRCIWAGELTHLAMELVRFDTQKIQNPEISGVEYQQSALMGYEVREYLLEKWGRKCAYCKVENVPLEVEHIIPKFRGGSNRVSNLTIACHDCNQKKGNQTAAEFGYPVIQAQAQKPLKDAAAVNATRGALFEQLKLTGLPIETSIGGQTKFNRSKQNYPKTHWLDAVCVGESGCDVFVPDTIQPLLIKATGRQNRQMRRVDKYGFPRTSAKQNRQVMGFQTGDMVKAIVTKGKKIGTYIGRMAVRASGSFNIKTAHARVQGISHRFCVVLHQMDGYAFA